VYVDNIWWLLCDTPTNSVKTAPNVFTL
jgi:putative transposase